MEPDASSKTAEAERPSRCPTCGTPYPDGDKGLGCPVCLFRRAFEHESVGNRRRMSVWAPLPEDGRFDHYQLAQHEQGAFDELGRGAMGITYRAIDTVLGHAVAIKTIDARIASRPEARERFLREARAAARLRHPNVASVFYYGVRKSDGQCFYAMELVEGESLEARVRRDGPLSVPVSLEIVSQVARAMAAAEAQGLVHRDLKPANLMLVDGAEIMVKVIDFGLAKVAAADQTDLTQAGFVGTPAFASPEQFAGAGLDVRSDLYSLGVTLWVILTGKAPFRGSLPEVMHQKLHAPLPLEQLNGLPEPMVALLQTLLEKDPARRFQSSAELLEMMSTVTEAMEAKHTFKRQKFAQKRGPRRTTSSPIRVPEQSIAVLPFDNLSDDKRDTYFADGIQDEILSILAKVSQLKVTSRTSVMTYRPDGNRDLRSIACALRVAHVVEGTVRRDGNRIRFASKLVDARTDEIIWSESYDRDLTDIFAIQSEVAQRVVSKLRAQLSSEERKGIEERPTTNLEAYDLYLQAKELFANPPAIRVIDEHDHLLKAVGLLEEAIRIDSKFALAYCLLTRAHDELYRIDHVGEQRALGSAAVNEALRIRPDLPEVHLAMAFHLYKCYRNYERARVQINIAERLLPNNPIALACTAYIDRRAGRLEESTRCLERALSLDPRNPEFIKQLAVNYACLRRNRDFERTYDQIIKLRPEEKSILMLEKAFLTIVAKGDLTGFRAALGGLKASMKHDKGTVSKQFAYAVLARDWTLAKEIVSDNSNEELYFSEAEALVPRRCLQIWLTQVQGDFPRMRADFAAVRNQLYRKVEAHPEDWALLSTLGLIDGALGRPQEAIKEAKQATEMLPISEDAWDGSSLVYNLAAVYALTNEPSLAFEQLAILAKTPGRMFYGQLKFDPPWDPLRKDPRFKKLLAQMRPAASRVRIRRVAPRLGQEKISVARLPITGRDVFGREEDIAFLDSAWAKPQVNVVTIVAWAGVGKSALVNHWLSRMAVEHYRSAELVFGWSFYRQSTSGDASSADEFRDAALAWFGDPDPRIGTAWEQGERLARLVAHRRTLLVLDGLEPLQNPPGPREGRLREPFLQALLRELAAFNTGLCVITTRIPVADIADHERTSALRRNLEQLSSDAGAELLRGLGVKGPESELRNASEEFSGHSLALTLLGSYLTDAYHGEIRCRQEVSNRLAHDVRQGTHARMVMDSYQTWFGEGAELAILRILGLFDRPVGEKTIEVLLKPPAIRGLTESLANLSPVEWQTILAKLRRARLVAGEDPNSSGELDTHPLIREYFGEQLRIHQTDAWKACNRRLYQYYRTLAPELPNSFKEMEPLFLAVICACNAGLFRDALHEVYISRIQRGNASFAADVLGARGALLSVLVHFFKHGRWGSLVESEVDEQSLTAEDQLFILIQAALHLSATRGFSTPEACLCYERAESLCRTLDHPLLLYLALIGQWRYSLLTDSLTATMQIAQRVYSFAQEQNHPGFMIGACNALAGTSYYLGDFENARQYSMRGAHLSRSDGTQSPTEEVDAPGITCLYFRALSEWHVGKMVAAKSSMAKAVSLAKELFDKHTLVLALYHAAVLGVYERNPTAVERYTTELIELSTRHNFASHLSGAAVLRGWARSASGSTTEGISMIEEGMRDFRAAGSSLGIPFFLALKAEALHAAHRTFEALQAIEEADAQAERLEQRWWRSELYRLRGVLLAAIAADETKIKSSFSEAIRIATKQKSISLLKRADSSYAEYRKQKTNMP